MKGRRDTFEMRGVLVECEVCGVTYEDFNSLMDWMSLFGSIPFSQ